MLRRDGDYVIYVVQTHYTDHKPGEKPYRNGEWFDIGDNWIAKVPAHKRFTCLNPNHGKHKEPFQTFSASGDCWQQTGIFGSFVLKQAMNLMKLMAEHVPNQEFRVAKLVITQHHEEIATMCIRGSVKEAK